MLAKYLKDLRASKLLSAQQALSQAGAGWSAGENGAIQRDFVFDDFQQASNFMNRYADFCAQLNHHPEWSNVYNRVSVRLQNREFAGVTAKEVSIANYLNTVSKATLNQDIDEELAFDKVTQIAELDVAALLNDQSQATSLFAIDDAKQAKPQLALTQ